MCTEKGLRLSVFLLVFSRAVQCLTNKWSETKNRALSEGKAPMGIRTTAVLGCIWSTKLMNATKRDRGVTRFFFFFFRPCTSLSRRVDNTTTLIRLCRNTASYLYSRWFSLLLFFFFISWCTYTCAHRLLCFNYLHSGVGVLFDPLDDRLVDQLLGLGVETVVGQIGHQILLGHAQNLLLSGHLKSYRKKTSYMTHKCCTNASKCSSCIAV